MRLNDNLNPSSPPPGAIALAVIVLPPNAVKDIEELLKKAGVTEITPHKFGRTVVSMLSFALVHINRDEDMLQTIKEHAEMAEIPPPSAEIKL